MDQQPATRIGAPPQALARRRGWLAIVAAVAVLSAAGGAIVAVYLLGQEPSSPTVSGSPTVLSVETQVECANIRHAYANWQGDLARLRAIPASHPELGKLELRRLSENGDEFLGAASGHKDQASKVLAVRIAEYGYELSLMALELQLSGSTTAETYEKTIASWRNADGAYSSFLALTCM